MTGSLVTYCLDANVLIQAWRHYYSPSICPDYWDLLDELGSKERVFIPEEIRGEITNTEDDLTAWLKSSSIPVRKTSKGVTDCWSRILKANKDHQYLVAEGKGRSLADPWVISHALDCGATVVTKEDSAGYSRPTKIKIPHVCDNMKIPWVTDFGFIKAMGIKFSCKLV